MELKQEVSIHLPSRFAHDKLQALHLAERASPLNAILPVGSLSLYTIQKGQPVTPRRREAALYKVIQGTLRLRSDGEETVVLQTQQQRLVCGVTVEETEDDRCIYLYLAGLQGLNEQTLTQQTVGKGEEVGMVKGGVLLLVDGGTVQQMQLPKFSCLYCHGEKSTVLLKSADKQPLNCMLIRTQ